MVDIRAEVDKVVAAMLTIAWASTKKRDVSQTEIKNVYEIFRR